MKVKWAFACLPLILVSCMSLPLPDTPEKSLLVIPCEFSLGSNTDGPRLSGISVRMIPSGAGAAGKAVTLTIPVGATWVAFAVDPGSYVVSSAVVSHDWYNRGSKAGSWQDTVSFSNSIYVEKQTVLLNRTLLRYADRADPTSGWDFSFYQGALHLGGGILAQMKADSHWSAWEGYPLVNFPGE